jgi:ABC-type amino acid transport system permease subunit
VPVLKKLHRLAAQGDTDGDPFPSRPRIVSLRQLIYDTRYRSMTLQVVAFILIVGSGLAGEQHRPEPRSTGQGFRFRIPDDTPGYDINQRMIEYSSDSTHGRAALVGILNTLLVAVIGCLLAPSSACSRASCACPTTGSCPA